MNQNAVRTVLALLAVTLCLGCNDAEGPLRERAQEFGDLLIEIPTLSETTARERLEGFIEPGPDRGERVAAYHADFAANSEKFRITSHSIYLASSHSFPLYSRDGGR